MSCRVCEMLAATTADTVLYEDELFSVFQNPQVTAVPGWVTLASKQHLEGVDGLTDAHALALGPLARNVIGSLKEAADADRVHVMFLGEHAKHFHIGLYPRRVDQAALFETELLRAAIEPESDEPAAAAVRAAVRERLSATAAA